MPMGCGNVVAFPFRATPCSASFHQLYAGISLTGASGAVIATGADGCIISDAFSSIVSPSMSFAAFSSADGFTLQDITVKIVKNTVSFFIITNIANYFNTFKPPKTPSQSPKRWFECIKLTAC